MQSVRDSKMTLQRISMQDRVNKGELVTRVNRDLYKSLTFSRWDVRTRRSCNQIFLILPVWLDVKAFDARCARVHVVKRATRAAWERGCVHKIFGVIGSRFVSHHPTQCFRCMSITEKTKES